MLLVILAAFDLVISEPHQLCASQACGVIECQAWSIDSHSPGAPVQPEPVITVESAECTEAGPVGSFHVEPTAGDIIGFCVQQHFEDGTISDCADLFLSVPGGEPLPVPERR